ncbi:MAG: trigger factor [Chloroflexi bacterium]|nr:MAG: trigger factor [Chloroflexota bacterium]
MPVKITTEELERSEVRLTVEFDATQEQELLKKAAKRLAREVKIPGYRPGKAPYSTIVRRFGLEVVRQEALELVDDKTIEEALSQAELTPYARISLESVSWEPLTLQFRVPVKPTVELGDYRSIRLEAEPVEVTDEDVEKALEELQEENATWSPVERPAQIGDLVSMTVTEKMGDTVLTENQPVDFELKPRQEDEDASEPDLTTPLIGLSAGETKTFTISYPEDYRNPDYAGKEVTITVEVSSVKEKVLDPLDDDFARMAGDCETLDELKEKIRQDLLEQRTNERNSKLAEEMLERLVEQATVVWPEALEEQELEEEAQYLERRLTDMGISLEDYLSIQQKTRDEWKEELRQTVVDRLKRGLVLGKVAELEGLQASQSEILSEAKILADSVGGGEALWRNLITSASSQSRIAADVVSGKAMKRLAEIALGEAPEPGAEAPAETAGAETESPAEAEAESEPATAEAASEEQA